MKNIMYIFCFVVFTSNVSCSQTVNDTSYTETDITLTTKTGQIFGTLCLPNHFTKGPVALIIAGSGPTDRNCNSMYTKTDAYKLLAHKLSTYNIATVRYDKRGIATSKDAGKSEADLRFDDYVNDASEWVRLLKSDPLFSKVIIIGHSEGSLIGMIAAQKNTDSYISIAGAGQSADKIITEQLKSQPQETQDSAAIIIDSLTHGKTKVRVPMALLALFRPSVQPYIISWFKYDPQTEIKKLTILTLIVQGTDDLQIGVDDAKQLSAAAPNAKLVFIKGMNHVFRKVGNDKTANKASYNNPSLPIDDELVATIQSFINAK